MIPRSGFDVELISRSFLVAFLINALDFSLRAHNRPFVVVESNKELIDKHEGKGFLFVWGNANDDQVLHADKVKRKALRLAFS